MRVPFIAPLTHYSDDVFALQSSRNIRLYNIRICQQRGESLFGIIGGLFKSAIPFLRSILLPEVGNFMKKETHDIFQKILSIESF